MMRWTLADNRAGLMDRMWVRILICILAPILIFGVLLVSQGVLARSNDSYIKAAK